MEGGKGGGISRAYLEAGKPRCVCVGSGWGVRGWVAVGGEPAQHWARRGEGHLGECGWWGRGEGRKVIVQHGSARGRGCAVRTGVGRVRVALHCGPVTERWRDAPGNTLAHPPLLLRPTCCCPPPPPPLSQVLRTLAGLWQSGSGTITSYDLPGLGDPGTQPGSVLFLPQKPYMVLGSLRDQLLYPTWADTGAGDSSSGSSSGDGSSSSSGSGDGSSNGSSSRRRKAQQAVVSVGRGTWGAMAGT